MLKFYDLATRLASFLSKSYLALVVFYAAVGAHAMYQNDISGVNDAIRLQLASVILLTVFAEIEYRLSLRYCELYNSLVARTGTLANQSFECFGSE